MCIISCDGIVMKILLVQTAFLGDVVLTTPLIAALKKAFPESSLTVLTTPGGKELLDGMPQIDGFILDSKRSEGAAASLPGLLEQIKAGNFDLAVAAHKSFRTAWLLKRSGIPKRFGFSTGLQRIFYHKYVAWDSKLHVSERYLQLMTALGHDPKAFSPKLQLPVDASAKKSLWQKLNEAGVGPGAKIAALCHGSVWATKRWPAESYAALADRLHEKGLVCVLSGGPEDSSHAEAIVKESKVKIVNLCGKSSLREMTALISEAALTISGDSAPMHIAAAFEVPQVALFGPTVSSQGFAPRHAKAAVAEVKDLDCRPCGRHGHQKCPQTHWRCMKDLSMDSVMESVVKVLGRG